MQKSTCPLVPPGHPLSAVQPSMHTPTPWIVDYNGQSLEIAANPNESIAMVHNTDGPDDEICQGVPDLSMANAQFIVRACNAHDQLLEACKMALVQIRQDNEERHADLRLTQQQVEAAIALAEGRRQ